MNRQIMVGFVIIAVIIAGCTFSLHPLYTPETLIRLPEIEGKWYDRDSAKEWSWIFEYDTNSRLYQLTIVEIPLLRIQDNEDSTYEVDSNIVPNQIVSKFEAGFVMLNGCYFMDLFPIDETGKEDSFYKLHYIPTHSIHKISIENDRFFKSILSKEFIDSLPDFKKNSLGVTEIKGMKLLTASTGEIQNFCVNYAADTVAFPPPDNFMTKVKN